MGQKVKRILRLVTKDLLPRFWTPRLKPFRILRNLPEYRQRKRLAENFASAPGPTVSTLRDCGYCRLENTELPGVEELYQIASAKADVAPLKQRGGKAFFSQLLTVEDYSPASVFLQLALNEKLLGTVSAYLGVAPFLEYVELLHSQPVETFSSSQLWHKDRTDRSLVKLFVYCRDVSGENGPFSFLDARDSTRVPKYLPHYLSDAKISSYVPLKNMVQITGVAGTAFLIDTVRCYHFGSRCTRPRLAFVVYYSSGFGYYSRESDWKARLPTIPPLTELQKAALGLL